MTASNEEPKKPGETPKELTAEDRIDRLEKVVTNLVNALQQPKQPVANVLSLVEPPTQPEASTQSGSKGMDLSQIAQLAPLIQQFTGGESNPMDVFFKNLGERTFYQVMDRFIPSRKEIRRTGRYVHE